MSSTASGTAERDPAERLGIEPGTVVMEIGYDDDCDETLREAAVDRSGGDFVDEDSDEVVDTVLFW
ncbi:MAG: DUF3052 family protein, partial [Geodermatophilaceae bacterium]|nr:DUF3052 family protein [Geodermatophilaceae bacterium]